MKYYDNTMRAGDRVSCQTATGIRSGRFVKPMRPNVATWGYVLLDGDEDYTALPYQNMVPLKGTLTNTEKFLAEYAAICEKYSMEIGSIVTECGIEVGYGDNHLYRNYDADLDEAVWTAERPTW